MNYLSFVVRIVVHDCEQCAVTPRDAIGGKDEEPVLIVVSWINTQRSLPLRPLPTPLPPKISFQSVHIFLIIIITIWCYDNAL